VNLEYLAAKGEEMPDGLAIPEQLFFLTLRELYNNFRSGATNREQAKREKQRIYVAYEHLKNDYKATEQHLKIRERLSRNIHELYKCGCDRCRHLLNIFTGIDRKDIPTDIAEVNAWNEKLREIVKNRSERNAELATVIDRVRWTLEGNGTTEEKLNKIKEITHV
jgi:hypothetical protein